jgi:hypothetical protein
MHMRNRGQAGRGPTGFDLHRHPSNRIVGRPAAADLIRDVMALEW